MSHKVTITDEAGAKCVGAIPQSWQEVGLAHYAALAVATTWPDRCRALAALCGLTAQPLLDDVSLCIPILKAAPWLLEGPLPAVQALPDSFKHLGVTYVPAPANLDNISAEQLEGLLSFLRDYEGNTLNAAPHLLAVLYKPKGSPLTQPVVEATAAAFASLPMATAWSLLENFKMLSENWHGPIQRFFAVLPAVEQSLKALEMLSQPSGRSGFCSNTVRWLTRRWVKRARQALR